MAALGARRLAVSDERLQELYLRGAGLDEAGRAELLAGVRRESPALAEELERLLRYPPSDPSPIDGSPWRDHPAGEEEAAPAPIPARIGRYRIVRELGRGGMGRVFLAEEVTEDFRRTLALKLVDRPAPDDEAIRRFRDEVRILASLEHPGIARFLDGGRSAEGIWFLALEYVDGRDLIEHAREHGLTVRERVELFAAVLDAVAYAHGCGVVHRDLKPSNVMVGSDGRPRLLDFGISKLIDPDAPSGGLTHTQWHPLTPAYASPEQFRGHRVSPRSDVYSLGVMLYELLAGRRPFAGSGSSRAELERAVLDSDPEPPSTAARRNARRRAAAAASESPPAGAAGIDRDLDAICLKSLERDPERRYEGAAPFLADLARWLAGQPVDAKVSTWRTALRPLARRERRLATLALASLVLAGLVALAIASTRWRDSRGEPAAVTSVAPGIFPFDPANPPPAEESERRLAEAPEDTIAGTALAFRLVRDGRRDEARMVVGRLRQIPGKELDPLLDYAEGRIASAEGEDQRALVFYTRARDRARDQGRGELLGTIRTSRAATLSKLGQRDASLAELEAARADSERARDDRTLYRTLNGLALEHLQSGDMAAGERDLEDALAAAERAGIEPITTLENLVALHGVRGRPDLAEPMARRLLDLRHRRGDRNDEGEMAKTLALLLRDLGRPAEAVPLFELALSLLRGSNDPNGLADTLHGMAVADLEDGRLDRVDALIAELEATARASLKRLPLGYAWSVRGRRAALTGDLAEARSAFGEARRLLVASGDRDVAALSDTAWADAEARAGEEAAALEIVGSVASAFDPGEEAQPGFNAAIVGSRVDSSSGRPADATRRLAALGADVEHTPVVGRRLAFLEARAAIAAVERRTADGRRDLETALELARRSGRRVAELELRLALAGVETDPTAARALAAEVARESDALGLLAIAERARRAAAAVAATLP